MFNLLKYFFLFEKYIKIKVLSFSWIGVSICRLGGEKNNFPFFFFFFFMPSPPEAENQPKKNAKEACN